MNILGLFSAPFSSVRIAEAPAPRKEAATVADWLCTATHDAKGKRIREREAQTTIRLLDRL